MVSLLATHHDSALLCQNDHLHVTREAILLLPGASMWIVQPGAPANAHRSAYVGPRATSRSDSALHTCSSTSGLPMSAVRLRSQVVWLSGGDSPKPAISSATMPWDAMGHPRGPPAHNLLEPQHCWKKYLVEMSWNQFHSLNHDYLREQQISFHIFHCITLP